MRKLLLRVGALSVAALAAGTMVAGPAQSQTTTKVTILQPAANAVLTGPNHTISIEGEGLVGLKDMTVRIVATSPSNVQLGPGASGTCTETEDADQCPRLSKATFSMPWNSTTATPYNGIYQVEATVRNNVGGSANASVGNIKVNNSPAAPSGAVAAYQSADGFFQAEDRVLVAWSRASDAVDHKKYRVLRSVNGGSYAEVMEANNTSYLDSDFAPGDKLKYQVIALRYSPVGAGNLISSSSVTTGEVLVPQPPPPPPSPGATGPGTGPGGDPLKSLSSGGSASGPVAPLSVNQPPEPVGRSGGVGFNRRLPFSQSLPQTEIEETAESGGGIGQVLASPARLIGDQISQNPVRFMAAGVLLLVTSGHLARAAKMLLPSPAGPSAGIAAASPSLGPLASLGKKTKPKGLSRWIARG